MVDAADAAAGFVRGRALPELDSDAMLRLALMQAIQIIGEAAARLSDAGRAEAGEMDWPLIIGMRNRIVHAYFDINADILWSTATLSLPPLRAQLAAIIGRAERS